MEKVLTQEMSPNPPQFKEEANRIKQTAAEEMQAAFARMKEKGGGEKPAHARISAEEVLITPAMRKDAAYHAKQLGGGLTENDR